MSAPQHQPDLWKAHSGLGNGGEWPDHINLRDYQSEAIRSVYRNLASASRRVCLVLPTGAGKTITAGRMVHDALSRGRRVVFTVPALSLVDQTVEAFEGIGIGPIGVMQADHYRTDPSAPVQVATVQTLARRGAPEGVGLVVVDEAHIRSVALSAWLSDAPSDLMVVGLTATPGRKGMAQEYDALVVGVTMAKLIEAGHLSDYRVFAPSAPDMAGVKTVAGDYHQGQAAERMQDAALTADIVQTWLERAEGRPTLLFAVDRAHAANLAGQFQAMGVNCGYQDANTDGVERAYIAREFAAGRMPIVANVGTLTTGVDWDVRCIVLARPTKSKMLHVQILGRGLRTADGKPDCLVLDHAGNVGRLGFPCQIDWSRLKGGQDKEKDEDETPDKLPKACQNCDAMMPPKARECPACGHEAKPPSGYIQTEEGELVEVTKEGRIPAAKDIPTEVKRRWYAELKGHAGAKGYKPGWAYHAYKRKFGVYPASGWSSDMAESPSLIVASWIKSDVIRAAKAREAEKRGAGQ